VEKAWLAKNVRVSGMQSVNYYVMSVFLGVLGTRFGSIGFKIGSLESEKIISGSLESEKSGPCWSILGA